MQYMNAYPSICLFHVSLSVYENTHTFFLQRSVCVCVMATSTEGAGIYMASNPLFEGVESPSVSFVYLPPYGKYETLFSTIFCCTYMYFFKIFLCFVILSCSFITFSFVFSLIIYTNNTTYRTYIRIHKELHPARTRHCVCDLPFV